jgi:hypothetical protein
VDTAEPQDPLDAGLKLARAFEIHGVSYALGGALAYGLWGVPRATVDVDINVFAASPKLGDVFAAMKALGIHVDEAQLRQAIDARGMFIVTFGLFRVDVFSPSIEFSWEAERTRVKRTIDGQDTWFLSAEALAVFKLLFFRAKDLVDLERMLAVQGGKLDAGYVRRQVAAMMGEGDERIERWDDLVALYLPATR